MRKYVVVFHCLGIFSQTVQPVMLNTEGPITQSAVQSTQKPIMENTYGALDLEICKQPKTLSEVVAYEQCENKNAIKRVNFWQKNGVFIALSAQLNEVSSIADKLNAAAAEYCQGLDGATVPIEDALVCSPKGFYNNFTQNFFKGPYFAACPGSLYFLCNQLGDACFAPAKETFLQDQQNLDYFTIINNFYNGNYLTTNTSNLSDPHNIKPFVSTAKSAINIDPFYNLFKEYPDLIFKQLIIPFLITTSQGTSILNDALAIQGTKESNAILAVNDLSDNQYFSSLVSNYKDFDSSGRFWQTFFNASLLPKLPLNGFQLCSYSMINFDRGIVDGVYSNLLSWVNVRLESSKWIWADILFDPTNGFYNKLLKTGEPNSCCSNSPSSLTPANKSFLCKSLYYLGQAFSALQEMQTSLLSLKLKERSFNITPTTAQDDSSAIAHILMNACTEQEKNDLKECSNNIDSAIAACVEEKSCASSNDTSPLCVTCVTNKTRELCQDQLQSIKSCINTTLSTDGFRSFFNSIADGLTNMAIARCHYANVVSEFSLKELPQVCSSTLSLKNLDENEFFEKACYAFCGTPNAIYYYKLKNWDAVSDQYTKAGQELSQYSSFISQSCVTPQTAIDLVMGFMKWLGPIVGLAMSIDDPVGFVLWLGMEAVSITQAVIGAQTTQLTLQNLLLEDEDKLKGEGST